MNKCNLDMGVFILKNSHFRVKLVTDNKRYYWVDITSTYSLLTTKDVELLSQLGWINEIGYWEFHNI